MARLRRGDRGVPGDGVRRRGPARPLGAGAAERGFEELWAAAVELVAPYPGEEAGAWAPPLEDGAYLEELRPQVEEPLRGEWDA